MIGIFYLLLVGWQDTITSLLLEGNPGGSVAIRICHHNFLGHKYFYLSRSLLSVVFILQVVQEVTQLFLGQRSIVIIFVVCLILNGYRKTILSCDTDFFSSELLSAEFPIYFFKTTLLI